jgi:hypothetical protein
MNFSPSPPSSAWFSGIGAPLAAKFGGDVMVSRTGNMVCWGYDGQSAIVELTPNGSMHVTFVDSEQLDIVSGAPAAAAYHTGSSYALDRRSCTRMIADLVDFFSGIREPKFTFVDTHPR